MIDIINAVRERISTHQAILYLLSKPLNQEKFRRDPNLLRAIEEGNLETVKKWFKDDLDSKRLPELRDLAGRMGIYPVYGKSRDQLVSLIKDHEKATNN